MGNLQPLKWEWSQTGYLQCQKHDICECKNSNCCGGITLHQQCANELIDGVKSLKEELKKEREIAILTNSLVGLGASQAYDLCISGLNTTFACILTNKEEVKK